MMARVCIWGTVLLVSACGGIFDKTSIPDFSVIRERLIFNGSVDKGTPDLMREILAQNRQITTLVLGRVDGVADKKALTALAYHIREKGLNTHLQSDSAVFSGGVELFMAGVNRTVTQGAEIGVHSWAFDGQEGAALPRDAPAHKPHITFTRDMLGSADFYWFTLQAAASDEIYIMNAQDMARFGLLTAPIIKL